MRNDPVRQGGLGRCCFETIDTRPNKPDEDERLRCVFCGEHMRYREGAWEWNPPVGLTD